MNNAQTPWAHIPKELDDAGLTPTQFRLYCHLVRRVNKGKGYAWPSIASMIKFLHISEPTINHDLNVLENHRFIKRQRTGGPNYYYILSLDGIIPVIKDNKDQIPSKITDQIPNTAGYKGNTYKVNNVFSKKVNQSDCCETNQSFNASPSEFEGNAANNKNEYNYEDVPF